MNRSDLARNAHMLHGPLSKHGYMRWWHSFTGTQPQTGESRVFFVEFFLINPALGEDVPILGQLPFYKKQGKKPSYCMVKAGAFPNAVSEGIQLHNYYPTNSFHVAHNPFHMKIEDLECSESRIRGFVEVSTEESLNPAFMTDAGYMEWDLEINKSIACHTGMVSGPFASLINALDTFWHGEGIQAQFRGHVTLNDVTYNVEPETSYGYADKHWGRNYNHPWLQLASCHLYSKRTGKELRYSAFALEGCCPRFLCFPLRPKLMMQLTYTGEDFEFSFARPSFLSRIKWQKKETGKRYIWHVMAQNKTSMMKLSVNCLKANMMHLDYESPQGVHRKSPLWGGGEGVGTIELYRLTPEGKTLLDTLEMRNVLCEYQNNKKVRR